MKKTDIRFINCIKCNLDKVKQTVSLSDEGVIVNIHDCTHCGYKFTEEDITKVIWGDRKPVIKND